MFYIDRSAHRSDRQLPVGLNKKVIGLMKNEMGGEIIEQFISLKPKLCSFKKSGGCVGKKCKGIKNYVLKKTIIFEDYKNCLFKKSHLYRSQLMLRLIKHDVHMIEDNKLALSANDDKRIIGEDEINAKARGHYLS